jgi:DNA-directed RNA polymerase alpha subunit
MPRPTPHQALCVWHELPQFHHIDDKVVAFANAIADAAVAAPSRRIPLGDLDIPMAAYGALRRAGYRYMDEIQDMTIEQLMEIKNVGATYATEIADEVRRVG